MPAISEIVKAILDGTWPFLLLVALVICLLFGLFPIAAVTGIEKLYPKESPRRGELYAHIVEELKNHRWTAPIVVFQLFGVALREAPGEHRGARSRRRLAEQFEELDILEMRPTLTSNTSLAPWIGSVTVRLSHGVPVCLDGWVDGTWHVNPHRFASADLIDGHVRVHMFRAHRLDSISITLPFVHLPAVIRVVAAGPRQILITATSEAGEVARFELAREAGRQVTLGGIDEPLKSTANSISSGERDRSHSPRRSGRAARKPRQ